MGTTVPGAMANLKASLSRAGAGMLEGLFPKIAPLLQALITAMGPVGSVDPDWAGATASRVRAAADAIERQLGRRTV